MQWMQDAIEVHMYMAGGTRPTEGKNLKVIENAEYIIACLEKQKPKKPTIIGDGENLCAYCECGQHLDWTYPGSNGMWRNGKTHKFCLNCGQNIDWSKVE